MRTINLIPQESKRQGESRKRMVGLVAAGLIYLLILGVITVWRQGSVDDAEAEALRQQQVNQQLQADVNALAGAEDLSREFDAAVATLGLALTNDVSWGRLLNDLGRLIPDRVWVTSYSGSINRPDFTAETPSTEIGSLAFAGIAFAPPDVAAWLRVLDSDQFPAVVGTWATGLTESAIGEVETVNFGSTTNLTPEALSGRLLERIPVIP
ncbi:MAG: PilN domain-containing protein [Acidimicrobiia bacterium]|nr:PilN domain-containing protein [Acidimicrobiia bacterium]NNL69878.1 PilN domain-containing protein [Acidimicrobiia bacterium]